MPSSSQHSRNAEAQMHSAAASRHRQPAQMTGAAAPSPALRALATRHRHQPCSGRCSSLCAASRRPAHEGLFPVLAQSAPTDGQQGCEVRRPPGQTLPSHARGGRRRRSARGGRYRGRAGVGGSVSRCGGMREGGGSGDADASGAGARVAARAAAHICRIVRAMNATERCAAVTLVDRRPHRSLRTKRPAHLSSTNKHAEAERGV